MKIIDGIRVYNAGEAYQTPNEYSMIIDQTVKLKDAIDIAKKQKDFGRKVIISQSPGSGKFEWTIIADEW